MAGSFCSINRFGELIRRVYSTFMPPTEDCGRHSKDSNSSFNMIAMPRCHQFRLLTSCATYNF
jgi:hypothetical protein